MIKDEDKVKVKMIAANCNTLLRGADWNDAYSCLAFASDNLVHIYDVAQMKTHLTLKGHSSRINGVKWIQSSNNKNDLIELLTCSSDGTVIHWTNSGKEKNPFDYSSWHLNKTYKLDETKSSINVLTSLYLSPLEKYFAAFSSSGHISLFYFDVDLNEYKQFDKIKCKKLQDAMTITVLNDDYLLLLSGGYDSLVNVYLVMRVKTMNTKLNEESSNAITPSEFKIALSGHLNDIRDISAVSPLTDGVESLYFATCAQDSYIRLWHVEKIIHQEENSIKLSSDVFDEYKSKTSYVIQAGDEFYNILLDSVLSGHDESVSSVRWDFRNNELVLLSSSFDFTVGLWKLNKQYNIWNKEVTLGEMAGNKHAFFLAMFADHGNSIIAYSYNGSFYYWKYDSESHEYKSNPIVHGHFGAVTDLDWDKSASHSYLVTTSADQTTRLFACWEANDTWHEVNRPQIHGYDINTVAVQSEKSSDDNLYTSKIVSGADEKIIRVFDPPFNLVKFLKGMSNVNMNFSKEHDNAYYEKCK